MVGYLVFLTIYVGLYSLFALGLNLQWGYAGLINFGHVAFMTVGAYATVLLNSQGFPLILAIAVGIAIAALLGLLIGMSTLKLREDYLAIVTIGTSELLRLIAQNDGLADLVKAANNLLLQISDGKFSLIEDVDNFQITRGSFGIQRFPLPFARFEPNLFQKYLLIGILTLLAVFATWLLFQGLRSQWRESKAIKGKSYQPKKLTSLIVWAILGVGIILAIYINGCIALLDYNYKAGLMLLVLITVAVVYWGLELLVKSPWGRVLKAIREDEEIARALGKNVFWYKLQAFMLGGAIAGLAGSFYVWQLTTIYPSNFETLITFNVWTMVVLGGAGKNSGAILGAIIFWAYDALTRFYLPKLGWFSSSEEGAFRIMVIGLILMVLMIWRPEGILGNKEELTLGK
ncbi:MAG: branched-chain amino acid ABC transporter permease [Cyanobacteria bacterium P01_G01_bin.19]